MFENSNINSENDLPKNNSEIKNFSAHLIEGVKPIMVCIGTPEDFQTVEIEHPEHREHLSNDFLLKDLKNLDWAKGTYDFKEGEDVLTAGPRIYAISPIDNSNKFSGGFGHCMGLIVAGIDKKTGENISFITHQPSSFSEDFTVDLKKRLNEMKERCRQGSVDAIIVGGISNSNELFKKIYVKTIHFLSKETRQTFGFEPVIVNGPKVLVPVTVDEVSFDNKNRRLYLIRSKVNSNIGSFVDSSFNKQNREMGTDFI
ncbi:hypothetical protein A3H53_00565 [Candidatus Nomurabacteria bacterium RIFCSPLOWO2_02_FULL_40_10]|uniref:Uncharacterized protein n=2 Tax=Candidatus Nomuraibacteriota TaxID=1752729 RepID=A0A1F6Y054_9BACT|nr:MAG: hypothetical protein A2642_03575 [Candidatus Nomurabacteria bacterium RIFCSPHIGHO2_01_FULL_39_10]OGI99759.1 MAG: hypothetical protein A3H53_00565 [Candidatus Nomurabacteria bacterium RIFCSPLOWO2_02_FULL_40_10]